MPKIVLDTNVIVSGLNFSGAPSSVLALAMSGEISNCVSRFILEEVEAVLIRKFYWNSREAREATLWVTLISEIVTPQKQLSVISDEADNRILECALEGKAEFIVSGDRHLKDLKKFRGIQIVDPAAFLKILGK